jgi:hypothetical protein
MTSDNATDGVVYLDQDNNGLYETSEAIQLDQEISVDHINRGQLRFKPDPNVSKIPHATFTYQVKDGTDYSLDSSTMRLSVNLISSTIPSINALNVNPSSNIIVVFTSDINVQTTNDESIRIEGSMSGRMSGNSYSYNDSTKTLTIDPNQDFMIGELIRVTFTDGIAPINTNLSWFGYSTSFRVIANVGYANFEKVDSFPLEHDNPEEIHAADIDGDGDIDIVIAQGGEILMNDGSGTFSRSTQNFTGGKHFKFMEIHCF